MDDAKSILLLLTRGPSAYLPRHVLEYSWHFGSRGRPYTIYSPAYRTFSAAGTHARRSLSPLLREFVYTRETPRARIRGSVVAIRATCEPRGPARRKLKLKRHHVVSTILADSDRHLIAMEFLQDKKLSATVAWRTAIIPAVAFRMSPFYLREEMTEIYG